jgi:predicted Holliday junction resolvase-like endonuclease
MEFQDLLLIVLGAAVGAIAAYFTLQAQISVTRERLIRGYEAKLRQVQEHQNENIRRARKESVAQSRNVLRGKMAEQFAPLLPGFVYLPADARFLGDPIDYVVFDGYSALRDGKQEHPDDLEVVILDIKQGRSRLSEGQRAIARAIEAGRVRFEVVRVTEDGEVSTYAWKAENAPARDAQGGNGVHDAEDEQALRERILADYPRAYDKWYPEEDRWLVAQFNEGREIPEVAAHLKRRPSAIRARLEKLGVEMEKQVIS